jgi:RNA polymerase sigma factor (sigma-70 family)
LPIFADKPELLRAFRAGDTAALEAVYWAYVDAVAHVVRRGAALASDAHVRGAPVEDWGDLVQETFTRAFAERARLAYDGLRPYRPYLLTICRNLLADWMRRRGRELPTDFADEAVAQPSGEAPSEPAATLAPGELAVVEQFLAGLDGALADVYRQRYVVGASQEEAARALGLSRQRVRTLEAKLRDGLRRALKKANIAAGL